MGLAAALGRVGALRRIAWSGTLLVCGIAAAAAQPQLIPMPRKYKEVTATALPHGVSIVCEGCSSQDRFAAKDLKDTLAERNVKVSDPSGLKITLLRTSSLRGRSLLASAHVQWNSADMSAEGYALVPDGTGMAVVAFSEPGLFYGAQTVKQLIDSTVRPATLHRAVICDWPAMKVRGLSDDLSRGPVPTLDFMKKEIRTLAAYKINLYSPYFEHTFEYASNSLIAPAEGAVTAAEAREVVLYAQQFHVTIAPEQEAFGHLHQVLKWEMYATLAETPHGQVLAPGAAGSPLIAEQMFKELASVFPGPYLHLGADETDELGKGQSRADVQRRGLGAAYLDYLQKLVKDLKPLHRKLLFWGDIAMSSPELIRGLPGEFKRNTIAVPWVYDARPEGYQQFIKPFADAGIECWVAPGVSNWSRVYPNFGVALNNIQTLTAEGQADGCTGQLNTVWNDDGETLFNANWYGVLFGAAAAWQQGTASIPAFDNAYGRAFHGDASGKIVQAQKELIAAHALLQDKFKRSDASDSLFWVDPWGVDGQRNAPLIRPYLSELRLHAERAIVLVREARRQSGIREVDALDAMELGARRMDLLGFKFQLSDEISQFYASAVDAQARNTAESRAEAGRALDVLNSTNGKLQDLRDGYNETRAMYERAWLKSNRSYWLRNNLDRYDMTIQLWLSRIDRMRSAQRQLLYDHTLPTAEQMGIPATPGNGSHS